MQWTEAVVSEGPSSQSPALGCQDPAVGPLCPGFLGVRGWGDMSCSGAGPSPMLKSFGFTPLGRPFADCAVALKPRLAPALLTLDSRSRPPESESDLWQQTPPRDAEAFAPLVAITEYHGLGASARRFSFPQF